MGGALGRLKESLPARLYAKWSADRAADGAVLIAWQTLLSLFPLILGLLSLLGLVLRNDGARDSVLSGVVSQFPSQVGDMLGFLQETRDLGGLLGLVSLAGLLWSGSNLFGAMEAVFNRFYGAVDRGFVRGRLMSFAMIAIYAVLVPVSVLASGAATFLVGVSEQALPFDTPWLALVLGWAVSFASALAMFLILFHVVPNTYLTFRDVWRGAVLAAILFVLLSQVFPLYLQFMGGGFAVYKTLGVFFLLMTWLYFLANVIVVGAELNALCSGTDSEKRTGGKDRARANDKARTKRKAGTDSG